MYGVLLWMEAMYMYLCNQSSVQYVLIVYLSNILVLSFCSLAVGQSTVPLCLVQWPLRDQANIVLTFSELYTYIYH